MKTLWICSVLLAGAGAVVGASAAESEVKAPGRERIEELKSEAAHLEAAGRPEEARRLRAEARALRAGAPQPTPEPGAPERLRKLRQERAELVAKLERLRAEGRDADAAERASRVHQIERLFRALDAHVLRLRQECANHVAKLEQLRAEGRSAGEAALKERILQIEREMRELGARVRRAQPLASRPEPVPPAPEARERHLRVAIEHLHAAGLHELAERLERERIRGGGPEGRQLPQLQPLREELRRLRAGQEELHQALRRLNERVERIQAGAR